MLCCSRILRESYVDSIPYDGMVYTYIKVPRYSWKVEFMIWSEKKPLVAYLRYNGLPTESLYDAKFEVPKLPKALILTDLFPNAATLYIGSTYAYYLQRNSFISE